MSYTSTMGEEVIFRYIQGEIDREQAIRAMCVLDNLSIESATGIIDQIAA